MMDLFKCIKILPTDYKAYGGQIDRWENESLSYPDCSSGCRHFIPLVEPYSVNWGVCSNVKAPRCGLLTWEHQAGFGCFKAGEKDEAK